MKTNAIIRIIIWLLVIAVLLGILSIGLGVTRLLPSRTIAASPAESIAPQWIEETHVPQQINATSPDETAVPQALKYEVTETTNIRSMPEPMSQCVGVVEAGQNVTITEDRQINGHHWGYIQEPQAGWILLLDKIPDTQQNDIVTTPAEDTIPAGTAEAEVPQYRFDSSKIRSLSIEWAAGNITIFPSDGAEIQISETGDTSRYPMELNQKNGKLSIEFTRDKSIGFGISKNISKDLTVLIPKDLLIQELDIEAASASVLVQNLTAQNVEFESASGQCEFQNCQVDRLDIDTASGDISFTGTLNVLECDAASASFVGTLSNVPRSIEMESMSGNLDLTLPENAGYTVIMEGMNTKLSSDFETTMKGNAHVSGDGACRIQMEAMNADVIIRKAK